MRMARKKVCTNFVSQLMSISRLESNHRRCVCTSAQLWTQNRNLETQPVTIVEARNILARMVGAQKEFKPPSSQVSAGNDARSADLTPRSMSNSYRESIIPLSDPKFREKYLNLYQGIRFGRIMENLDTFAVYIGYTHATKMAPMERPISIVTALVDKITLENSMARDKDIKMKGQVTWTGTSSMEITMNLEQETGSTWSPILNAKFLMVARDPATKKAAPICPVKPENDEEQKLYREGEANRAKRKEAASQKLLKVAPSEEERKIIHEKFLQTIDPSTYSFKVRVKPENSVWMENSMLKNMHICFPENRNLYGKIFGGYLMRKGFELAWANAALYSKSRPTVKVVDDIAFLKPVEISNLLFWSSQVVYTEGSMLQVHVHAESLDPVEDIRSTTNDFHFTFETNNKDLPKIMPKSYAEYLLYIDGKRHFYS